MPCNAKREDGGIETRSHLQNSDLGKCFGKYNPSTCKCLFLILCTKISTLRISIATNEAVDNKPYNQNFEA